MNRRRQFLVASASLAVALRNAPLALAQGKRVATAIDDTADCLTPKRYGAIGDGIADDTLALNAMYADARAKSIGIVFLRGHPYRFSNRIDAHGVSTAGEGAVLKGALTAAALSAFSWGGSDTFVDGVVFDLHNKDSTPMQGVWNGVDGAVNQRFRGNRIVTRTTSAATSRANIYGAWFAGAGLVGLFITDNQLENCGYGIQVNNQRPLGRPRPTNRQGFHTAHVHIADNTCIGAAIGVNTPDIPCSHVVIDSNTIEPGQTILDLPINIAHVIDVSITGNAATSNAHSANGTIHVEDASGAVTITGNTVEVRQANNGIQIGVRPSFSEDDVPATRIVVTGNHIQGAALNGDQVGILMHDHTSRDTTVNGNYVHGFPRGIVSVEPATVVGNTISGCPLPVSCPSGSVAYANAIRG